jgi:PD-(D/E)XK nuclease superfamily
LKPFLEILAEDLLTAMGDGFSKSCVVFPSRRSGIFFRKCVAEKIPSPLWLPEIYSIQDFINKFSPYLMLDKLTLVFELFEVYRKFDEDSSFEKFYPWGEMLLGDFDDIDKNLVDASRLFRILEEHKEVEEDFELKVSDFEEFHRFWQSFSNKDLTDLQTDFINTWEIAGKVYHLFRKSLVEKNYCYEGMAYRRIYELLKTEKLELQYEKVIFAGFNQLNKAEDGIIRELKKRSKGEVYFDTDGYYLDDNNQEAGLFLRKNIESLELNKKDLKWKSKNLSESNKSINVIGAPLMISQAKVLGNELSKISNESLNNTAVVLPDESLLLPVLYSIPGSVSSLNITMGFPLRNSPLYSLVQQLRNLQKNKRNADSSVQFYHRDVVQILSHPYIQIVSRSEVLNLAENIKRSNIIFLSHKRIVESFKKLPGLISLLFDNIQSTEALVQYLYRIFAQISEAFESETEDRTIDREFLFKCYSELNRLSDIITRHTAGMEQDTFWKLLLEVLNSLKIPFTGEPLRGLQIMGVLETRLLDFENVFILSMNEGIMPRGNSQSSFIPYHLRKAFRLPCFEDEDSASAYNFYRLIQRAKNVWLIYNSEAGELLAGEKSRFIMQIESELTRVNPKVQVQHSILQADLELPKRQEIVIEKKAEVLDEVNKIDRLSATSLSRYIHCPLMFYFDKVAELKEPASVDEYFTGGGFGSIFHQIMDLLYRNYKQKTINEKTMQTLISDAKSKFDDLWEAACGELREFREFKKGLRGKNLLYKSIIQKLVLNVLQNDMKEAPFKLLDLETELTKNITIKAGNKSSKSVLFGRLDRVEEKDGIVRIIDYKTGRVEPQKHNAKKTDEQHIEDIFTETKYKENFQQMFYAYMYSFGSDSERIKIGLYPLRKPSRGIYWFENEPISHKSMKLFENVLNSLLEKIFDESTPFTQTSDYEKCIYCAFKSLCYRD